MSVYFEVVINGEQCFSVFMYKAHPSPHVKSGIFMGQMKSIWRAMTSPAFDFQGDLYQQGGAIIAGPGEHSCLSKISFLLCCSTVLFLLHHCFFALQALKSIFPISTWTAWTTCPLIGSCSLLEFNRLWTSVISQRSSMCSQLAAWKRASLLYYTLLL